MLIKADLHVHTIYSKDSVITPAELVFFAKKRGLNAVAVTDHNQLNGAYQIARGTDFLVLPGMEVSSREGHIVALNVSELIPKGLGVSETIEKIHKAGGVAIACHPYALFKGSLGKSVSAKFDAIEVINARAFPFSRSVQKAEESATLLGLPRVAGTDAHYGPQIGYGYTVIDAAPDVDDIAKAIKGGHCQPFGKPVPLALNLQLQLQRFKRMKDRAAK